jgi:Zn ribbon nucleic-acid-binding protein
MAPDFPRRQWPPCPACRSRGTIKIDQRLNTEALYCPGCGHKWDRDPPPSPESAASGEDGEKEPD